MNGPPKKVDKVQDFENQVAHAMRRVDPPTTFADAVMGRAASEHRPPARVLSMQTRWRAAQTWAAGAVAAALLLGVGVQQLHHHRERTEATREFEVAVQIEQQALHRTRERLSRSGISLEP